MFTGDDGFIPGRDYHLFGFITGEYLLEIVDVINSTTAYSQTFQNGINAHIGASSFSEQYGIYDLNAKKWNGSSWQDIVNWVVSRKFRKEDFLRKLEKRIFVLDGAMGTELQKKGFAKGCPDELNITKPELIKAVHKSYADAGSDIIITNTFGANRLKLSHYSLGNKVKEINEAGVKIAREACPNCLIAGDIGPLGIDIEPLGELGFDEAYGIFKEQVLALKGADLLIIETISDIKTLKAALIAAKYQKSA